VIAGLERDDDGGAEGRAVRQLGQRVDFGMGGAGAAVPALREGRSITGEDYAAHPRVHSGRRAVRGQFEGVTHGALDDRGARSRLASH
jgi:hypothetical protein